MRLLDNVGRLFTATGDGVVAGGAVVLDGERIAWAGPADEVPGELRSAVDGLDDLGGGLVTPGLVDAHTHPVWAGNRFQEVALRSAGASYAELAAVGGIGATVRATREASTAELEELVTARLRRWLAAGTTTVEAKTGYHLERDGELAAVGLLDRLRDRPDLPRLAVTFLGAHAVPPGSEADAYTGEVASWCAAARAAGADFCDVFCDEGYFSVEQAERVLAAGTAAGLVPRLHADELARTGGAVLAARLGAASADHLLRVDASDAARLAAAGVVATLAPTTALGFKTAPPARVLLDAGVTLALGTDHNPGTSGTTSMSLVVALAVAVLGLSVDEALLAATLGGARSLRLDDAGQVRAGARADLVAWDADHEGAFAWAFGLRPLRVWRAGAEVPVG